MVLLWRFYCTANSQFQNSPSEPYSQLMYRVAHVKKSGGLQTMFGIRVLTLHAHFVGQKKNVPYYVFTCTRESVLKKEPCILNMKKIVTLNVL